LSSEIQALGRQSTRGSFLTLTLGHVYEHPREIACLKGIQGGKGYAV
jgi:hypothetical protein